MKKLVTLITETRARALIPKLVQEDTRCYYLVDDPEHFSELRSALKDIVEIHDLEESFHSVFKEIREPYRAAIFRLNRIRSSVTWWSGQLASQNNAGAPLPLLHVIYLFCAKKIMAESKGDVFFILKSPAMARCIRKEALGTGLQVRWYRSRMDEGWQFLRRWISYAVNALRFILRVIQSRWAARLLPLPPTKKNSSAHPRLIIRSWITKGVFDAQNQFHDRNFGSLPDWLISKNYEIWTLPMYFNLSESLRALYARMKQSGRMFLIPDHFLSWGDYVQMLISTYHLARQRQEKTIIEGVDVTLLFEEAVRRQECNAELMTLNLVYPMLKRMKELGYEIDRFYYPFENNPPEKPFILGCREFFPKAGILGFQHTVCYPESLSYQFNPQDEDIHPLPDRIVCSGPIYIRIYTESGFPFNRLALGANLRFQGVALGKVAGDVAAAHKGRRILFLPLACSKNLAFDLFIKVKEAVGNSDDYMILVRNHPLLPKHTVAAFLKKISMKNYKFADQGIMQDWIPHAFAVFSSGLSVTALEAVVAGVPAIRVVPNNTFFFDSFTATEYPLSPVVNVEQIQDQLDMIGVILKNKPRTFKDIAPRVFDEYFRVPEEKSMSIFL